MTKSVTTADVVRDIASDLEENGDIIRPEHLKRAADEHDAALLRIGALESLVRATDAHNAANERHAAATTDRELALAGYACAETARKLADARVAAGMPK